MRMELSIKVMISRMFAEFEQRKKQLEERDKEQRDKAKEQQAEKEFMEALQKREQKMWEKSRQKRVQGSHFAHPKQASAANQLVIDRRIDPGLSEVFPWTAIPEAHDKMLDNKPPPGNMGVLVTAQRPGLRTFEEVVELSGQR